MLRLFVFFLLLFVISIVDTLGLGPDNPITTGELWMFTGIAFVAIIGIGLMRSYQRRADQQRDEAPVDLNELAFDYVYQEKFRDASEDWTTVFSKDGEKSCELRIKFRHPVQRFLARYLDFFVFHVEVQGEGQTYDFKHNWKHLFKYKWDVYANGAYMGKFQTSFKAQSLNVDFQPEGRGQSLLYERMLGSAETKAWAGQEKVMEGQRERFKIRSNHRINVYSTDRDPALLIGLYHLTVLVRKN
ncbi:hypothetical protein B0H94_11255 [Salsuginibacillus halophilus]|uniref:Tubby C-terminal domain-containing protein n=1 Tax=Salsuginibacillus halophilus TaxID=517424 RepID=A0A2P8H9S3_9BACI|nr:hypothetical protein [Salsuginibacillus halophilus]PSL42972.1 hypothetical protein B0H94_11255 [Salsuginibacillus halophilus]